MSRIIRGVTAQKQSITPKTLCGNCDHWGDAYARALGVCKNGMSKNYKSLTGHGYGCSYFEELR